MRQKHKNGDLFVDFLEELKPNLVAVARWPVVNTVHKLSGTNSPYVMLCLSRPSFIADIAVGRWRQEV